MKVEILEAQYVWTLQNKINSYLKNIDSNKVVDIKFQGVGCHAVNGTDRVSAMIILR